MSTTPPVVDDKKVVSVVVEAPVSPNAETDKRVSEVLNDKKKKKHPVEARIAELTKKNAALEEKLASDKKEVEGKLAEQNEKNIQAELDRRKAQAAADDKRPEKAEGQSDADFSQKMAEWVIRQQDKIQAKAVVPPPVAAPPDPAVLAARKEEFDGFLEAGKEFIKTHADFNDVLQKASERGLTLDNSAMAKIVQLKAPAVGYYLARPENEALAKQVMKMRPMDQVDEIVRIHERLKVNPADFVSSAGNPGMRLNGNSRADVGTSPDDVDAYLAKRRADIKAGLRRR